MSQQVFVGHWTDHAYGSIQGARLTLSVQDANYVISFLAIFNGWIGTATWKLIAFVLHQYRSTPEARDGAFHQTQAALRNSARDTFILNAIRIGWAWRKRSPASLLKSRLLVLAPATVAIVSITLSILSSRIASNGSVLLAGGTCGSEVNFEQDVNAALAMDYLNGVSMSLSNAYAQQCYANPMDTSNIVSSNSDASRSSCVGYVVPALNFTVQLGVSCPFEDACAVPDEHIIQLDTGLLDSYHDFGINQPQENRVLFRRLTTCSPLITAPSFSDNQFRHVDGFESLGNISIYSYGQNDYQTTRFGVTQDLPYPNVTFVYGSNTYLASQTAYYLMVAPTMLQGSDGSAFKPLPQVIGNASTPMSLMFLANRAFYQEAVDDPWFNATFGQNRTVYSNAESQEDTIYSSNNPGSVLACTEQAQICNPNARDVQSCTDLDSWYTWGGYWSYYEGAKIPALDDIGLNDMQQTTAMMLSENALSGSVWNVVDRLGDKALMATNYLAQGQLFWSSGLANNQWQIEVANWFSIGLAQLQRFMISNYRKPSEQALLKYWDNFAPSATVANEFCNSQMVQSAQYTTLNVFYMAINLALGLFLIICGYALPSIILKIQKIGARKNSYRREQWLGNHFLQLQRLAHQALQLATWEKEDEFVPITRLGEEFAAPPLLSSMPIVASPVKRGASKDGLPRTVSDDITSWQHGELVVDSSELELLAVPRTVTKSQVFVTDVEDSDFEVQRLQPAHHHV